MDTGKIVKTIKMSKMNKKIGLAITLLALSINARAITCSPASGLSTTISSDCTALSWSSGNVIVNSGVTVDAPYPGNAVTIGSGTVGTLTNSGTLAGGSYSAIDTATNNPTVTSIVNTLTGILTGSVGIYTYSGSVGSISNAGQFNVDDFGILNYLVTINTIENTGVIDSGYSAIRNFGTINTLTNSSSIAGDLYGIQNFGTIEVINNIAAGSISGSDAIYNTGTITNLINSGSISNTNRVGIYNLGTITTLTNSVGGVISDDGSKGAIFNDPSATIVTFNNAQGGDSSSASKTSLVYNTKLPENYNIIITSSINYGQLSWTDRFSGAVSAGITNFGIYAGGVDGVAASTVSKGTYTAVLSNLTSSNIGATRSGTYNGLNWILALQSGSTTVWDLIFSGATTADT